MRRFGILYHRGAAQVNIYGARKLSISVYLNRNVGAARSCQYMAIAKIGSGKGSPWKRKGGERVGRNVCASTPTIAAKRAVRVLLSKKWY